jgi:RNA polymerase sigma-70 factor, ECF subfamily
MAPFVSPGDALVLVELPAAAPPESGALEGRLVALVTQHSDFVWRSLVRLGVPRADAEDAVQQVFLVVARKLDQIELGRERAFLFGTALRIAARARRTKERRREVLEKDPIEQIDPTPGPDVLLDRAHARAVLDRILDAMPLDLRAVFVLFELEQASTAEIATLLDLPAGTVASRLRRAREHVQAAVKRIAPFRGESL